MSISADALAQLAIAQLRDSDGSSKTPPKRTITALADRSATSEPR